MPSDSNLLIIGGAIVAGALLLTGGRQAPRTESEPVPEAEKPVVTTQEQDAAVHLEETRQFYESDLRDRFGWTGTGLTGNSNAEIYRSYLAEYSLLVSVAVVGIADRSTRGGGVRGRLSGLGRVSLPQPGNAARVMR